MLIKISSEACFFRLEVFKIKIKTLLNNFESTYVMGLVLFSFMFFTQKIPRVVHIGTRNIQGLLSFAQNHFYKISLEWEKITLLITESHRENAFTIHYQDKHFS